jgi:hypothetical protein
MRKCKCGNQVAENANACPRCGHKFTSGTVKFLAWSFGILGLIMFLTIIGTESTNPTPSATSGASTATPASAPKPKPMTTAQMVVARRAYAKVIDQQMLDKGIESKTFATGPQAKTLVIEDALAGRVRENEIGKNSQLFQNLHDLGFTHLRYQNGFEGDLSFGVTWTITP